MRNARLALVASALAALGAAAPAAQAQTSTPQVVSGTTLNTLAIGATTPAVLSGFAPGQTATSLAPSPMSVVSTSNWALRATDATNGGHLKPAAAGCAGSASQTANQLRVQSASNAETVGTITHAGLVPIGSAPIQVANSSLAQVFEVSYSIGLGSVEQLLSGCVYSTTVTWTVQ